MIFSSESVKSLISTCSCSRRAASSAASLARFARSAPTMPGVLAASASRSTLAASGIERVCTSRISRRPLRSGACTATRRSKRPGSQQRRVEHVGAVGRGEHDDCLGALEAIHLGQDLVERLLALVVGAGDRDGALARAPDRVELVDEDDRRRGLLGLREQVAHARGADADDRLDELRGGDREERRVRLPGDGAREQRLAGAGGAREQHAVGHAPAQAPVALGIAQEVDDLRELGLGLVDAGDVVEGHADRLRVHAPRLRAPEVAQRAHRPRRLSRRAARAARTGRRSAASGRNRAAARRSSEVLWAVDLALTSTSFSCSSAESWLPFQKLGTSVANSVVGVAFLSLAG